MTTSQFPMTNETLVALMLALAQAIAGLPAPHLFLAEIQLAAESYVAKNPQLAQQEIQTLRELIQALQETVSDPRTSP